MPEIGQRRVLEMIARGAPIGDTLETLLRVVEAEMPDMLTSILLLEEDGCLRNGAAPRLPEEYVKAVNGVKIGPAVGSCGTAAWRKEAVFVADIASDPLWEGYRQLALPHELRACWCTPIFDARGAVLGTFAIYYREAGLPSEQHIQLIAIATHTAAICISHHRAEQALRSSEARARAVADHSPVGIFMCDADGKNVYMNRAFHEQLGAAATESIGERWVDYIHPADRERVVSGWERYLERSDMAYEAETRVVRRDGAERVLQITASPVHETGRLIGHVGNSVDITERKRTEQLLHERESRLRAIIETDPECLKLVSRDGRILEMNPAGLAMIEAKSLAEAQSRPVIEFVLPAYRAEFNELSEQAFRGNSGILEFEITGLRGTRRWLETHVAPMRDHSGEITVLLCLTRDITARKRAEATLRESEERFREVVENISEGFWVSDAQTERTLYVSPRGAQMWGLPVEDFYRAPTRWLEAVHPEDRARVEAALPRRLTGEFDETYRVVRPDGTVVSVRARAFPVREADRPPHHIVGVIEDVTERTRLESEVMRAHRVESVGRLANGIAHDMNNILAPMVMAGPLLRMGLSPEQTDQMIATIETNAKRGAELVRQLLIFSRGVESERGPVSVAELVGEIVQIARQTFPRNIEIETTIAPGTWFVRGDTTQLHQVLLNLCVNARDAMPRGGALRLSARNVELSASGLSSNPDAKPGPYVVLRVADTGVGIPSEIAAKIFDPFFSTKGVGKGTGLGLSTVLGIVHNHGGVIRMTSEVGQGSAFEVFLPAMPETTEARGMSVGGAPPKGNGEMVLVVDDEESIRGILGQVLLHSNYRVVYAGDGAEALAVFTRNAAEIKVVITDLDMPVMDGVSLARVLRKMNPRVSVLVASGVSGEPSRHGRTAELHSLGIAGYLAKPYTVERVLTAVHEALHAPGAV